MKKRKAQVRGIDASGFIAPLSMGGGIWLGKKGADYLTVGEKPVIDFLGQNPMYAAAAKTIGGILGFNPVSKLINSVVPLPLFGEGLMGGIIFSGIEDGMFALDPINKGKPRLNGGNETDNYDWERLYNEASHEATSSEGGRL